jgi:hypothetical protein
MKQISNQYAFERISSSMTRTFGKVKKGKEEDFALELASIEGNLLKTYRKNKIHNGRRTLEAIKICFFIIDGYINNCEYDLSKYKTPENEPLVKAILMAFDPFTNEAIREALDCELDRHSLDDLREHFTHPIQCLLRIEESVELWTKRNGPDGYFNFTEEFMGTMVPYDETMDFSVMDHTTL